MRLALAQLGRAPVAGSLGTDGHQWARGVGLLALQQLGGGLACLSAPAVTAKRRYPGIPCCGLAGQSGQGGDVTWRSCCPKSPKTSTWTWIEPETNLPTPQLQLKSGVAAHAARPAALRPPVAHRHVSDGPAYPARQLPTLAGTWSRASLLFRNTARRLRSRLSTPLTHTASRNRRLCLFSVGQRNAAPPRRRRATASHAFALPPRP